LCCCGGREEEDDGVGPSQHQNKKKAPSKKKTPKKKATPKKKPAKKKKTPVKKKLKKTASAPPASVVRSLKEWLGMQSISCLLSELFWGMSV
jgi:hypothetical protein